MSIKLNWYWISYSLNAVHQGTVNTQARSELEAIYKIRNVLKLEPPYDIKKIFILPEGNKLPPDQLFSSEYLDDKGYEKFNHNNRGQSQVTKVRNYP